MTLTLKLHVFSAVVSEEPECRFDQDCPAQLTCMSETCQNPCTLNNPCTSSQTCVVSNDASRLRTVSCVCPVGQVVTNDGNCKKGIFA